MLAELTNGVLKKRDWSLQQAENFTRVKKGTIHNMRIGRNVDAEHLIRFAIAVGDDPNTWLKAGGKDFILPTSPPSKSASTDPLAAIGDEIDPKPFIDALNNTAEVGAGPERGVFGENSDALITGPFRTMRVRGDCMEPALRDGDVIFVQSAETVRNGDLVIATVDFVSPTCKRICIPEGKPSYLEPINGEGIIAEERFVVTGVVKFVIEDVQNRLKRREGK